MYLLHGIIKPTRKGTDGKEYRKTKGKKELAVIVETGAESNPKEKKKKTITKYGITDSIESMMKTQLNISATAQKKKVEQPHILCIGDDIYHLKEFFIVMEDTKYVATSFLNALEITFKIFNLFNFQYPLESINVWLFVQKFFFDLHYKEYDFVNNDVSSLIEKLCLFEEENTTENM